MARGNLPAQTPLVPQDTFVAMDEVYRYAKELGKDVGQLEGIVKRVVVTKASNITLAADPVLQIPLRAHQKISLQCVLYSTANVKYRTVGPAGAALLAVKRSLLDSGGATVALDTAYSGTDVVVLNASILELTGIIHNGATAGIFSLSWAQNSSNATPSQFYIGSWLQYALID